LKIPQKYFFDFLRGHLDGDGTFIHTRIFAGKQVLCFILFCFGERETYYVASEKIYKLLKIKGHVTKDSRRITYQLKYAKNESKKLLKKIYYFPGMVCLSYKYLKIKKALQIENR